MQRLVAPVLAGVLDGNPSPAVAVRLATAFPPGTCEVQQGGNLFPWLDAPEWFSTLIARFLDGNPPA
ncbi:hypothetical protein [Streptomyces sp. NPDC048603]|uniref:hypothetical protein n=1 Tax=Streptomyces sp. NPDC048603 TaxID=3365577 RepID=UPI003724355B